MSNRYNVFGLVLESEIDLPELPSEEDSNKSTQIKISLGQVPEKLENAKKTNPWHDTAQGEFLLRVDGIAKYWARGGETIVVDPQPQAAADDIRVFLYNSVFAQLLSQRGLFIAHGSAVCIENKAVLFLGGSTVGKTSLAFQLYREGYCILGDEVCAVTQQDGRAVVLPGIPQLNVWQDTLTKNNVSYDDFNPIRGGIKKFAVPLNDQYCGKAAELSAVIILKNGNHQELSLAEILGAKKFQDIMHNSFRVDITEVGGEKASNFIHITQIAKSARIYHLKFDHAVHSPKDLTDLVLKELTANE